MCSVSGFHHTLSLTFNPCPVTCSVTPIKGGVSVCVKCVCVSPLVCSAPDMYEEMSGIERDEDFRFLHSLLKDRRLHLLLKVTLVTNTPHVWETWNAGKFQKSVLERLRVPLALTALPDVPEHAEGVPELSDSSGALRVFRSSPSVRDDLVAFLSRPS